MLKRAALYIRVSTDQQAKHGDSLDAQIATLKDYVSTQDNLTIIDTYIDDGISGQKLYRDEFQRLLEDIKKNRIDIILFTKLDRWFRNLRHYLNIQEILDNSGVTWLAVSQPFFNTDTAYGRSFVNQSMSFAELEAQMASERIKAVFENKIRKGEVVTGSVPFGY
ncbi:recombinase family protein, partial [Enterococcus faecalis]|nr:recombinase family protein [Enterococcus faecalis]